MRHGWVFFSPVDSHVSSGSPHVLRAHMGVRRACGEPNEIEWTPIGVELNGSRCAPKHVFFFCQTSQSAHDVHAA